ncbi:MAG: hypothetical protein KC766_20780 [Myxococcales bacterium]|nr:hypothetical protein [Myxococcales bacterium]
MAGALPAANTGLTETHAQLGVTPAVRDVALRAQAAAPSDQGVSDADASAAVAVLSPLDLELGWSGVLRLLGTHGRGAPHHRLARQPRARAPPSVS